MRLRRERRYSATRLPFLSRLPSLANYIRTSPTLNDEYSPTGKLGIGSVRAALIARAALSNHGPTSTPVPTGEARTLLLGPGPPNKHKQNEPPPVAVRRRCGPHNDTDQRSKTQRFFTLTVNKRESWTQLGRKEEWARGKPA